ncbi:hypothetical protein MPTK1_6g07120 [Marchantia polymorpha subsp. ruderalis]|uniref:Uncharacterized protein n=2 Tax=Marchantia polymorpha TaxID=3197 RepID=A0AAF6BPE4_MARPO|nr:hypothetical protein MARPO_0053s0026 [Marchantia polymorpha]BBN13878.1 hypothetical protein Mp_6g07120 [Marchantia polymorpha subsp. ruderalis]|eukprot:PTQ38080.1 hypothetical protein MARPO_0053s0026 [Marchantia polymorpha]
MATMASTASQQLRAFGCALVQLRRPRVACNVVKIVCFQISDCDLKMAGFSPSSGAFGTKAAARRPQLLSGQRKRMTFSTNALPADTYWITVVQALGVSVFMALAAVISGVVINVGLEVKAVKEFAELDKQGLFKEEDYQLVPDEDFGSFENEEALYIFTNKDMAGNRSPRNRPVREAEQQELQEVPTDQ